MPFEDFDKKIKEAADQHHPAYDEKAWRKMEKLLDEHLPQQKDDRRRILFFLLGFLLLGGGLYVAISKPWNKKPVSSEFAQKNQTKVPQPSSTPALDQDGKSISPSESDQLNKKNDNKIAGQQPAEKKTDVGLSVVDLSSNKQSRRPVTYDNSSGKNKPVIKSGSVLNKVNRPDNDNVIT